MINGYTWLDENSQSFLEKDYLIKGQTVDNRVDVTCNAAEERLKIKGFAKKFKSYVKKGWYSFSSPIWSNYGNTRGFPISCYGSSISDSMESILYTNAEIGTMTKYGGGTSAYLGKLRPRGSEIKDNGYSSGSVHFAELIDSTVNLISQGSTRRGNCAVYQDINHKDIMEFLRIRTEGHPIQDLSYAVCISDDWMNSMLSGDRYKREVWAKVIERRRDSGYPYLFFTDNATNGAPKCYRDKGITIDHSQLCSEIMLPSNDYWSFICCLMSLNLLHYEDWKDTDCAELAVYFLDTVISEFIEKASSVKFMEKAVRFAEENRAIGVGVLGWHSLLQSKMIPFEHMEAKRLNVEIFRNLKKKTDKASNDLFNMFGPCKMTEGYDERNTCKMAIAPTTSSSFILGGGKLSKSIEPEDSNYFVKDLAKGKHTIRNPYLTDILESRGLNIPSTWKSIMMKAGSVQHLDCLNQHEKDVFKTFAEISQKEIIIQNATRQKYIDQGISLNTMIHSSIPPRDISNLYIEGWRLGMKSFYYQRGVNASAEFTRSILECKSCEA